MIERKFFKHCCQLVLAVLGKELVHGGEMLHIGASRSVLVYKQDQRLQQIALAIVPEVVSFSGTGVADDNIGQHLRHQGIAV